MTPGLKTQKVGNHWSKTLISQIQIRILLLRSRVQILLEVIVPYSIANPYLKLHLTKIILSGSI